MVILRGWAEAPLSPRLQGQSPGAQGRPTGRATTLKAKSPRALPQRADLTSPTGAREFRSHQTAQTLLSAQAVGPQQAAHPTPTGTPHSRTSPAAGSEFGVLPGRTKSRPGFLTTETSGG